MSAAFRTRGARFPIKGGGYFQSFVSSSVFPVSFIPANRLLMRHAVGVSTVVSAFFLSIAFKAYSLKQHFTDVWEHSKREVKKVFTWGDPPKSAPGDEKV